MAKQNSSFCIWPRRPGTAGRRVPPATWRLCVPRRSIKGWPGPKGGRWLLAYPHETNGLANRLAGIRASLALAQQSRRTLLLRWFGSDGQEGAYLLPARTGQGIMSWRPGGDLKGTGPSSEGVPGVAYLPDGKVHDAWGHVPRRIESHWFRDVRTHHFNYHPWARLRAVVDGVYSSEEAARDERQGRLCARALISPFPTNCAHQRDVQSFLAHAKASDAPIVVTSKLFHDALQPGARQDAIAQYAHAQYRALFRPTAALLDAACAHLRRVGLRLDEPWIGLQFRRTANTQELEQQQRRLNASSSVDGAARRGILGSSGGGGSGGDGGAAGPLVPSDRGLKHSDRNGVDSGVRCALQVRSSLCERDRAMCRAPIFVTSSSAAVLQRAVQLLGADARYSRDDAFTYHGAFTGTHLAPLLEFATLSASRVVIGTAGSSFAAEAANMGNTTAIVRMMGGMFTMATQPTRFVQGECTMRELPPPADSVLLPRGSCARSA